MNKQSAFLVKCLNCGLCAAKGAAAPQKAATECETDQVSNKGASPMAMKCSPWRGGLCVCLGGGGGSGKNREGLVQGQESGGFQVSSMKAGRQVCHPRLLEEP